MFFLLSFFDSRPPGRDGLERERHTSGVGSRTPANQIAKDMEMEKDSRFRVLKEELLERAHKAGACRAQYSRAYGAQTLEELMQVVRDNFWWACYNRVIDGDIVDAYRDEFATGKIWHNENITEGFLIASGSATVEAYDSATVEAYGSATVEAYGSAYVCSWSVKECQISDHAVYRIMESNTIRYADPDMEFEKITQ